MGRASLRPVDLARAAGVSTQQVRNYEDAGLLPPAARTPTGHRRYEERHRSALLTYRALAAGYGRDTAQGVIRAVHAGDVPRALTLIDAAHAALHEERRTLRATGEALEAVAEQAPPTPPSTSMRIGEVAAHLGVRTSALRVWEAAGLLSPDRAPGTEHRRYRPEDVRDAQMIRMLRQGRHPLSQIRVILDGLRRTGDSAALREAIARRRAELVQRSAAMLEGSAHLHRYLNDDWGQGRQRRRGVAVS
ncbi:MAG TPA: MerR family transcriptional regulator [Thermomonospora sp.]|nr:MerR family transcriptional regulator [Thermomonospora sp.]